MPRPKEGQPRTKLTPEEIREIIGDPRKVAREMAMFRKEAKRYDPIPDKILILGVRTPVKRAA